VVDSGSSNRRRRPAPAAPGRAAPGKSAPARKPRARGARGLPGPLDAANAGRLIHAAADISLLIDGKGIVREVWYGSTDLAQQLDTDWVGKPWADTVSGETRDKTVAALREAAAGEAGRWRQVNHPTAAHGTVPVVYRVVALWGNGDCVAVGRDLRPVASLQQRLIDAEQAIERDYTRLRHAETRYRQLFQLSAEAVLVVGADNLRIVEANPASAALLDLHPRRIVGRAFPEGFSESSGRRLTELLAAVRTAGSADDVRVRSVAGEREFVVSASMFQQDGDSFFLVRMTPVAAAPTGRGAVPAAQAVIGELIDKAPDALLVTDEQGRVVLANRAFVDLVQLSTVQQAKGESLERWLGRPGMDLSLVFANVRQHGTVRQFPTTLRGEYGLSRDVEISAVALNSPGSLHFGLLLREASRRATSAGLDERSFAGLPRSPDQLTDLVGRVALKDLVRETTDIIEKLCIEAALRLTQDNRVSAAEMLGLSRQSLYVKLRRFGLVDGGNGRSEDLDS
jgi:transcriptional regulator PpsR